MIPIPGKVSTGFNVWMLQQHFNGEFTEYRAEFHYAGEAAQPFSMLVNLAEGVSYMVVGTGCTIQSSLQTSGGLALIISDCSPRAAISIQPVDKE